MSINYTEKGPGQHEAIRAAGEWLRNQNGDWIASDPVAVQAIMDAYTLDQAKGRRKSESLAIAKALRDRVVSAVSPGEMAAWPIKRDEALKYATSGNPADAPLLSAEAQLRGITLAEMLSKVSANSTYFATLEAQIGGADGKHRDSIDALTTFEAVNAYDLTTGWPEV